jgi:hypothetical protein
METVGRATTSHSQVNNDTGDYYHHCNNTGIEVVAAGTTTPVSIYVYTEHWGCKCITG